MLRGDRGKFAKIGLGLLFAVIFATGIIGYGLWESAKYERQSNTNTNHYSEYTRKKIAETCVAITPVEKAKCMYEARDQEREYQYNQSDLVAQRKSALWAYIMGLAAVIGMALSALGVWLVKTTFDETRKANLLTKRNARAFVEPAFRMTEGNRFISSKIGIFGLNVGEGTAQNAVLSVCVSNELPSAPKIITEPSFSMTIQAGQEVAFTLMERQPPNAVGFYLFGTIDYNCSFGDAHTTYFCVRAEKAIADPAIRHRGDIVFRPCKSADWPKDT
jgi:hypothetical protein